jgi:hypothetical protein
MKHFTANGAQPQTSAVMNSFPYDIKKLITHDTKITMLLEFLMDCDFDTHDDAFSLTYPLQMKTQVSLPNCNLLLSKP